MGKFPGGPTYTISVEQAKIEGDVMQRHNTAANVLPGKASLPPYLLSPNLIVCILRLLTSGVRVTVYRRCETAVVMSGKIKAAASSNC